MSGWHEMWCDICGVSWMVLAGPAGAEFSAQVIDAAHEHWVEHVKRGEDPRIPAHLWTAYARPAGFRRPQKVR